MPTGQKTHYLHKGFTLLEAILSGALFIIIATAVIGGLINGRESTALAGARGRAALLAEEGLEAARNIRDNSFANLVDGTYGLATTSNQWTLAGSSDAIDGFTRQITIGTVDADTKSITSTVTWQQNLQRMGTTTLNTQLTNWRRVSAFGGMLVYGDGGTTLDTIRYRVLSNTGIWGSVLSAADIDTLTTNKALRHVQIYASKTRNEKIILSRHYSGSVQFIYGQVYNGTSWGSVQLLGSWTAATFLDVQNFDGDYLTNGDFVVVYSDNTTIPKFRTWNGSIWSTQGSLPNIGGVPNVIVTKNRPTTNEVMTAFYDQTKGTNTVYFNGGAYATAANWVLSSEHAATAQLNTIRMVDFAWSPNNPLKGALVYSSTANDRSLKIKIWTANGSGSGAWSAQAAATTQVSNLGAVSVVGIPGRDAFLACDKDTNGSPRILCYQSDFTPTWTNTSNQTLITGTDTGIQRSYDIGLESLSGAVGLAVYSDRTTIPKLKKYVPSTLTFDTNATNLSALTSALETVRIIPDTAGNDIMIILGDSGQDVYSVVWNGTTDQTYTTPLGKAFSTHGLSGSTDEDFWYDFVWDRF